MCNSYRILQQISESFYNEFDRRSGGVHWEICVLYAKMCVCVCVWKRNSVDWRGEQGVGWWAKACCLQVQSARESGIKLSHPHINYSEPCTVRVLACYSGRRQTWVRSENRIEGQKREGGRREDQCGKTLMIWEMVGVTVACRNKRHKGGRRMKKGIWGLKKKSGKQWKVKTSRFLKYCI